LPFGFAIGYWAHLRLLLCNYYYKPVTFSTASITCFVNTKEVIAYVES
jgi:hypothetical protein